MKTNARNLMMVIAAVAFTACSNTDVFDNEAVEKDLKASYAENFAKKYPNVDMSKGWDFSTKTPYFTFGSNASKARTRADVDYNFSKGDWYEVDNNTLTWMKDKLTEGEDNRYLGKPFYMTVPSTEFTIVPIFQGQAGAMWNLHVVVDGVDLEVWKKSNNDVNYGDIQIKDGDKDEWHNLHGGGQDWETWPSLFNTDGTDKWLSDGSQNIVTAVRSIPITFKNLPVGAEMYFYLDITVSGSGEWAGSYHEINNVGDKQSSVEGMMLALEDVPLPTNIDPDYEAMIIGCEDANLKDSDHDLNDLVLLVYGKKIPKPIEITEGTTVYDSKTVRYMIEDLGSTDDFDFNDIVIDVTESVAKTPVYVNDVFDHWNTGETTYKAVIRHLGGTLPFVLKIGDTEYAAGGQETFQTSPNTLIDDIKGYNMNLHNISVQVKQNNSSEVWNKVTFPKAGEAPMIIAVDPTQNWMPERQSVPESWFYIPENK